MIDRTGDLEYGDKYTYASIPLVDHDRRQFIPQEVKGVNTV